MSVDGFVYMSEQVHRRTEGIQRCPGPVFPASAVRELRRAGRPQRGLRTAGAGPTVEYVLFFGLIRDYKGLDLLLDAWAELRRAGRTGAAG